MDKNFKVRLAVGAGMFIVAIVGLYTFDSVPFRILYALFALMAAVEAISFVNRRFSSGRIGLLLVELAFIAVSTIFVWNTDLNHIWYVILGVPGYDIFAYFYGKLFGGKVFGKSRPFPKISKNKTWEGTILGLITAVAMVLILMAVRGSFDVDWYYLFCGPLALIGDLYESYMKRRFDVKDSNEIVVKSKLFAALEHLVGGSEGHGGFLDRIDSMAFTCTILLVIMIWI